MTAQRREECLAGAKRCEDTPAVMRIGLGTQQLRVTGFALKFVVAVVGILVLAAVAEEKPANQVLTAVSSTTLSGYVSTSAQWGLVPATNASESKSELGLSGVARPAEVVVDIFSTTGTSVFFPGESASGGVYVEITRPSGNYGGLMPSSIPIPGPLGLNIVGVTNGQFGLSATNTFIEGSYQVQTSSNCLQWTTAATVVGPTNGSFNLVDTNLSSQRFYRLVETLPIVFIRVP